MDEYMPPLDESAAFIQDIDPSKPLPVDLEAIQALKFECEDPDECGRSYKEEGNYHFKKKEFSLARENYTGGIKASPTDKELLSTLYCNRAACEFQLKNFGSCIRDCRDAIKCQPSNRRAHSRLARALLKLEKYKECMTECEASLLIFSDDNELIDCLRASKNQLDIQGAARRRQAAKDRRDEKEKSVLIDQMRRQGVARRPNTERLQMPEELTIELDSTDNCLLIPVLVLYPEFGESDTIKSVRLDSTVQQLLETVLSQPASWNQAGLYRVDCTRVFVELDEEGKYKMVENVGESLRELFEKGAKLTGNVLVLSVVSEKSQKFYEQWVRRVTL